MYLSYPHFYGVTDPEILSAVEGLTPDKDKHETVFKIQDVGQNDSLTNINTSIYFPISKVGTPINNNLNLEMNNHPTNSRFRLVLAEK